MAARRAECVARPGCRLPRSARAAAIAALALGLVAAGPGGDPTSGALALTSSGFSEGDEIPMRYTCQGADVSPELRWSGAPEGSQSLVLIVSDPDVPDPRKPVRSWIHWVLYDLPPEVGGLPEAVAPGSLPAGARQGRNDWGRTGYGGPCPPIGRHRYIHALYALDTRLGDLGEPTEAALARAMRGRVLAEARLIGTYAKRP